MIDSIIAYSVRNKIVIGVLLLGLITWGLYSLTRLPVDAVPDITNNQVQIITTSPNLATQEVEKFITTPIELDIQNLPGVVEIRSISRFGLSVVTVVFRENMGSYLPRQLVSEALQQISSEIPPELGQPELAPITTGLGEIVQYTLRPAPGYEERYDAMALREIQDWIVARQLAGIPGVVEINSLGGYLKQYEVAINPERLRAANVTLGQILTAVEQSNENTGGAYIEKVPNTYFIRAEGMVSSLEDIGNTVVANRNGVPILVRNVADVRFGHASRYGAITMNGEGEVVGGIVMMLKGANSNEVTRNVMDRIEMVKQTLPEGVLLEPYLVREKLVHSAISTVKKNLIEGGLIVVFVLVLLLGSLRGGLIVASVIPLSMLFAFGCMRVFGVSANLMSLGAIDFGLIVDGAVIIVEGIVHGLHRLRKGITLTQAEMDIEVKKSASILMRPASFGVLIILIVYLPILALTGIEGKMFKPMAMTVSFALIGALVLSLTYVPMMSALFLKKQITGGPTLADRIMKGLYALYAPAIRFALRAKGLVVIGAIVLFGLSLFTFSRMGGEFIPTLEEGDLALHQILGPGSSLQQSVLVSGMLQKKLLDSFPEVEKVVTKIGSAEVPTDPMPIETGDIMVVLKPRSEWTSGKTRQELFERMGQVMADIPGVNHEYSQPIQMRFNELMTGSRGDIAVKIFGEDLNQLFESGQEAERIIRTIDGVGSVRVEQTVGMPQIVIRYDYARMAQYGLQVADVNRLIRTAFAGEHVGIVYQGDRRFDLVVRLEEASRQSIEDIRRLFITLPAGEQVPLAQVANIEFEEAPLQISRDNTRRRIVISVNAGDRDVESLVTEIQDRFAQELSLPPGYTVTFGGQFENLIEARSRLALAVPLALGLIFVLLYFTFGSAIQAGLIFTAIPLSAIGGIWALWLRGMPFSISAGVGFIALFGVAVLNGIVLITYFNQLREGGVKDIQSRIIEGTKVRFRPVIMTAAVASLGFLPMALSHSGGAEVQRPLATVVIGGLVTATLLTLIVLPVLYSWTAKWRERRRPHLAVVLIPLLLLTSPGILGGQSDPITLDSAIQIALKNHPRMHSSDLRIQQQEALQGTGFAPPRTTFFYAGDALGKGEDFAEHAFGVSQGIALPAVYRSRNEMLEAQLGVAMADKAIRELDLRRSVTMTYYDILAASFRSSILRELDSIYSEFNDYAALRYETGAANALERTAIQSRREVIALARRQSGIDVGQYRKRMEFLLVADTLPEFVYDTLSRFNPLSDTSIANHPAIQLMLRQQDLADMQIEVAQAQRLPTFQVQYAYEIFSGVSPLHGVQMGISLPIFGKTLRQNVEAAEIEREILIQEQSVLYFELEQGRQELLKKLELYDEALQYYEDQGRAATEEILRTGALSYRHGDIGYLEYLEALDQVFEIRQQFVNNMQSYNRTLIALTYLTPTGNY